MTSGPPSKRDLRQEITDQIIRALEQGTAPWQKPWQAGALELPFNPATGKPYRGGNVIQLMIEASSHGYDDPRWLTYRQAQENGWQVRRGEKSTHVEFWQFPDRTTRPGSEGKPDVAEAQRDSFIYRVYTVFNAKQIDGIPPHSPRVRQEWEVLQSAQAILDSSGARIQHDQSDRAFYNRGTDTIHLPPKAAFKTAGDYFGTALHEASHNAAPRIMPHRYRRTVLFPGKWIQSFGIRPWFEVSAASAWCNLLASSNSTRRSEEMSTVKSSKSCARMKTIDGPLGDYLEQFRCHLESQHYSQDTIGAYARYIRALAELMREHGTDLKDLDEGRAVGLITSWKRPLPGKSNHVYAVKGFVKFLTDLGAGKPVLPPTADDTARGRLKRDYEDYLRRQRGLSERTIWHCWWLADHFLKFRFGDQIGDLSSITPIDIVRFLQSWTARGKPCRNKTLSTHLRNFFQYLFRSGKAPTNLALGIPKVAQWSGARLPRHLTPEQVESLIRAVRTDNPTARRNYAMVLLLARLGLRAQEVIAMQIDDIDWRAGELIVRGKGQRHDRVPLPQDVGEALADYIRHDRVTASRALFVTGRAPRRSFKGGEILNAILKDALVRTGLKPTPYVGSHILRHSLATALVQRGASLEEIGDLLRHRSLRSTLIYAKLDVEGLRSISQPWPVAGGAQ